MKVSEFTRMVRATEYYCFGIEGLGETGGKTIELSNIVELLESLEVQNDK